MTKKPKRKYRLTSEGREILKAVGKSMAENLNASPEDRRKYGSLGGKAKNPNKGFGSRTREELQEQARAMWQKRRAQ